ncbi:MAG: entericidin A/B family lipoprotein [Phycisphaeraceae bacterium]|nr:MAG: entericidin A/B family lipoprotein [Phycisphaeraceae bacterium]
MTRISLLAALAAAIAMTGCNTVKGVGRDIEAAGEKTQKAIND